MKRILFLLIVELLIFSSALATQDNEEVSITIFDAEGLIVSEETAHASAEVPDAELGGNGAITLTMSFTGDVTIGSNVQHNGKSIFEKELDRQEGDLSFPFRNVKSIFIEDDLTLINFEGTLTTEGRNPDKRNNSFLFRADPSYVSMLSDNGVESVSLENNHVLDMGVAGLSETKKTLVDAGISFACEDQPAIIEIKGVRIGSLAYQTFGGRHDEIIELLPRAIDSLRDRGCDIVIVSYHWGDEKDYKPNDNQIRLGRATIDAGADLVIGHHSHRINPIEYYKGHYICYSLGNFSFAGNNKPDDMSTYIFQIQMLVENGQARSGAFRIIPCRISSTDDYNDFAPTPYTEKSDIEELFEKLKENGRRLEYAVSEYPLEW